MDQFLEACNLLRLKQEDTENLNRPVPATEIEAAIKTVPGPPSDSRPLGNVRFRQRHCTARVCDEREPRNCTSNASHIRTDEHTNSSQLEKCHLHSHGDEPVFCLRQLRRGVGTFRAWAPPTAVCEACTGRGVGPMSPGALQPPPTAAAPPRVPGVQWGGVRGGRGAKRPREKPSVMPHPATPSQAAEDCPSPSVRSRHRAEP